MVLRKLLLFIVLGATLFGSQSVHVAAAANVGYAIKELARMFEKSNRGVSVKITLASSGKLATQILHHAPFDIFLSANVAYAKRLYDAGVALKKPRIYAKGALALLSVKKRTMRDAKAVLLENGIGRIALANPKTAPYGAAARTYLERTALYERLKPHFIYGESIGQTLSYTLKAADAGIVAKSLLFAPQMHRYKEYKQWITLPSELYEPIKQAALLLEHAKNNAAAKRFYTFLFSKEAQALFRRYGYEL